jgi:GntR family transcriptional regulator/MocR family aminotransferase
VQGPEQLDARELKNRAREASILIESGDICFMQSNPPLNYFRLGYSSIAANRIEPGVKKLADLIHEII